MFRSQPIQPASNAVEYLEKCYHPNLGRSVSNPARQKPTGSKSCFRAKTGPAANDPIADVRVLFDKGGWLTTIFTG